MSPATGFSYHRLQNEGDNNDDVNYEEEIIKRAIEHVKSRIKRSTRLKRVHIRKKLKMKIPSLRKFMRRRARIVMISMAKVLKRLKESQSHFGDLFAGNYLFMQVNPAPLKSSSNSNSISSSSPYAINNHGSIKRLEDELRRSNSPRVS